jgi:hypothetical protein
MVRFSSNFKSKSSQANFPSKNFGVVVQLVRGSKLPLDYVRDLVLNMGIPVNELSDVIDEGTVISIVCSTLSAASVLIRRGPLFAPAGVEGWKMILRDALILPEVADTLYPSSGLIPLLQDYPGSIFAVNITRAFIVPIMPVKRLSNVPVTPAPLPSRMGPQFKAITILPRPRSGLQSMEAMTSQIQNVVNSTQSSHPPPAGGGMAAALTEEYRFWIRILEGEDDSQEGYCFLANVVHREISRSAGFRELVVSMFTQDSSMPDTMMQENYEDSES